MVGHGAEAHQTTSPGDRVRGSARPAEQVQRFVRPLAVRGRPVHPVVASLAVGSWLAALVFDVVSWVSSTEWAYARGAWLLTGLGVGVGLVAAQLGAIDLQGIDRSSPALRTGMRHLLAMDLAIVAFALSFVVRTQSEFGFHETASVAALVLSLVGVGALAAGVWLGSSLTYRFGVGVRGPELGKEQEADEGSSH